jgi:hypothetical protein
MHVPALAKQDQLTLGVLEVELPQRDQMEGPIPGGEPGELPFVRHRHDVDHVGVRPVAVAPGEAALGRWCLPRIPLQPLGDVVVEELLGPQDAGEGLALDAAQVLIPHLALQPGIEPVRLRLALAEDLIEVGEGRRLGWT